MPMNRILNYKNATTELSKREKIGQLFMPAAFINDTEEEIQILERLIEDNDVGGLCFFHSRASAATNYEGKKEIIYNEKSLQTLKKLIHRYQLKSKYRLLIAIDAEWGLAMRIENTPQYPYAITLGAIQGNLDLIFQVGKNIALDCKLAGIHYNLSPVADINNNPNNPVIGYRSFGEDKENVAEKSAAYVKGMQIEGILSSVKHFPGHGDTATDSHLGLPVINKSKKELLDNELYPFKELAKEKVDSIMVGHLAVPALSNGKNIPSSISSEIINGLLRNDFGYDGVVISDALNMHAVSKNFPVKGMLEWKAFNAGNDILCFAEHTHEGIETILKSATENQIEAAFERVWRLKEKAINAERSYKEELKSPYSLNKEIAKKSITLINGNKDVISFYKQQEFVHVSNIHDVDNQFIKSIKKNQSTSSYTLADDTIESIKNRIRDEKTVLITIFPPQVKPTDNFGFASTEVDFINELMLTKNVILYFFGNPYALKVFKYKNAKAVILAYQDFKVFQEVAAEHFFGEIEAVGKLPVNIG
jgi:beta-glucosidase-like glycosyl hydrolase